MEAVFNVENMKFLFKGIGLTLYISAVTILISTIFGSILGVMRNSSNKALSKISATYFVLNYLLSMIFRSQQEKISLQLGAR